jgi:TRAP-type C4-dicarboxylate transport system permease small subunit
VSDPFTGPRVVSFIFKGFAILSALAGLATLLVLHRNDGSTSSPSLALYAAVVGGTLFAIATLLFFAYVLELLADIKESAVVMEISMTDKSRGRSTE